jgi:hypothetical protein
MSVSNILRTRFIIKKDKARDNLAPVYARITLGGKSVDISLRRDIDVDKWDAPLGRAKATRDDGRAFNLYLDQVRAEITNCCSGLKNQKKPSLPKLSANLFCGIVPKERTRGEFVEYHNGHLKHTLAWGTMKITSPTRPISRAL